jgi:serine/threonine-protein kinase
MRGEVLLPPRYRDPERVAGGGMGDVYRASDATLGRTVAIKLLPDRYVADEEMLRRFRREALAAARLSGGPNTVTVYDVGEWQGRPFIVMEYLAGGSLQDLLHREGAQPPGRALAWLAQAAAALDHAHANGVVHRDVKPANLLLDREGQVHVADFGIASAAGLASMTQTGTVLGTAGYLAPEQAEGKPATAAADRYALGVVAFALLTGERPVQRDSLTAEASAHVHAPVPSASARQPELPTQVDPVFARALAKDPQRRFASCGELVDGLQAALHAAAATTQIAPALALSASWWRSPRTKLRALLALLALASGILGAVLASEHNHVLQPAPRTVTAPAKGQTVTVTTPASTQPVTAPTTTSGGVPGSTTGADLNRQALALIQAGDFQAALPLLRQAVQALTGTGTPDEANADYNLAYTITQLGSCDGVLPLLDRAQTIQADQSQIDQLRATCTGPPGHRPGHGHANKNNQGNP